MRAASVRRVNPRLPLRAVSSLAALSDAEKLTLAQLLRALTSGYDRLFDSSFP